MEPMLTVVGVLFWMIGNGRGMGVRYDVISRSGLIL